MPEYFKEQGYVTYGQGKLYHPSHPPNNDYPASWSVDSYNDYYWGNNKTSDAKACGAGDTFHPTLDTDGYSGGNGNLCPGTYATDDPYYDHQLASRTIASLDQAVSAPEHKGKNFAIWIGECFNVIGIFFYFSLFGGN